MRLASIWFGQVIIWCILVPTIVNSGQWLNSTVLSNIFQSMFTCFRYLSSNGPTGDVYLLWYAMLPQFTSFANTPCSCSVLTNFVIDSAGPDSVQKLGPLWHATSISGGHSFLTCSAPRPARHVICHLQHFNQFHIFIIYFPVANIYIIMPFPCLRDFPPKFHVCYLSPTLKLYMHIIILIYEMPWYPGPCHHGVGTTTWPVAAFSHSNSPSLLWTI